MSSGPKPGDVAEQLRTRIEDYIATPSDRNSERVMEAMRSYANLYKVSPISAEKPAVMSFSIHAKAKPAKKMINEIQDSAGTQS